MVSLLLVVLLVVLLVRVPALWVVSVLVLVWVLLLRVGSLQGELLRAEAE